MFENYSFDQIETIMKPFRISRDFAKKLLTSTITVILILSVACVLLEKKNNPKESQITNNRNDFMTLENIEQKFELQNKILNDMNASMASFIGWSKGTIELSPDISYSPSSSPRKTYNPKSKKKRPKVSQDTTPSFNDSTVESIPVNSTKNDSIKNISNHFCCKCCCNGIKNDKR